MNLFRIVLGSRDFSFPARVEHPLMSNAQRERFPATFALEYGVHPPS
jgi:hypothetical protein